MIQFGNKTVNGITIGGKEVATITIGGDLVYSKFTDYFYIKNNENLVGTVSFTKIGSGTWTEGSNVDIIEYSTNKTNWSSISIKNNATLNIPANGTLYLRNTSGCWSSSTWNMNISCDTMHNVGGNIMSLLNYTNTDMSLPKYCFANLFKNDTKLRKAEDLILPPRTSTGCYRQAFYGANSLLTAPVITSPTASTGCYYYMFSCPQLDSITCYYTGAVDTDAFNNWLYLYKTPGTFYNYGGGSFTLNSGSGIPSGWTVVTNQVATPTYSVTQNTNECGQPDGQADMELTCDTAGATIYYKDTTSVDMADPDFDWNKLGFVEYISPISYQFDYNENGEPITYYIQAKAIKTGMNDSEVVQFGLSVDSPIPCEPEHVDCTDWENMGYESFEECDCSENGNCGE